MDGLEDFSLTDRRGQWRGKRPHYNTETGEMVNYCDKAGAMLLKLRIEAYWRERGEIVTVYLRDAGFFPSMRSARVDVRSDMIGGMPRKAPAALPSQESEAA